MAHATTVTPMQGLKFLAVLFLTGTMAAVAQQSIDRSALPPAVEKTVEANSQGATIKAITSGTSYGKQVYEVQMTVDGQPKDIEIASDGALNGVMKDVTQESLGSNIENAVISRVAGANITRLQSITRDGRVVGYKISTNKDGQPGEVHLTALPVVSKPGSNL
jgi:hypothetical protein